MYGEAVSSPSLSRLAHWISKGLLNEARGEQAVRRTLNCNPI